MPVKIFIIAGEASGDALGQGVIQGLKKIYPDCEIRGIGGESMMRAGLTESLFPMDELSVMGIAEILPRIPKFLGLIAKTVQAIRVFNPDIVLTIDAPDFSFRVQKRLKAYGLKAKQIHYVAPTVWAWRAGRAAKVKQFLDGMICLFPFEPIYFEREGLKSIFVGHPMVSSGILEADGKIFREQNNIHRDSKVLGLFCGSRTAEVTQLAPLLCEVAQALQQDNPNLICVLPTLPKWHNHLEALCQEYKLKAIVSSNLSDKWLAFKSVDVALAVSGTVALEIALAGIPHALVYKMNSWTWSIVRRLVKTKYAHLGNILLDKPAYQEFLQDEAEAEKIIPVARHLLDLDKDSNPYRENAQKIHYLLEPNPNEKAADKAAAFIKSFIQP
jgi:lipid-A-disaccharide synthase